MRYSNVYLFALGAVNIISSNKPPAADDTWPELSDNKCDKQTDRLPLSEAVAFSPIIIELPCNMTGRMYAIDTG